MAPRGRPRGSGKSIPWKDIEYSELDLTPRSARRSLSVLRVEDAKHSPPKAKSRSNSHFPSSLGSGFDDDILDEDLEQLQDQLAAASQPKDIAWSDAASVSRRSSPPAKRTPKRVGQHSVFAHTFNDSSDSDIEDLLGTGQEPKSIDPNTFYSSPKPGDNHLPPTQTLSQYQQSTTVEAVANDISYQIDFSETASTFRRSSPAPNLFDSAAFDFATSAPATPHVPGRVTSADAAPAVQTPENTIPAEVVPKLRISAQKLMDELRSEPDRNDLAEQEPAFPKKDTMTPQTTHQSAMRKKQRAKSPVQVDEATHRVNTDWEVKASVIPSPQPQPGPTKRRQPVKSNKKAGQKAPNKPALAKVTKKSPAKSPVPRKAKAAPKGKKNKKRVEDDEESAWQPKGRMRQGSVSMSDSGQVADAEGINIEAGPAARTRAHDKKTEVSPPFGESQDLGHEADQLHRQSPKQGSIGPQAPATASPQEGTETTLMDDTTTFGDTILTAAHSTPPSSHVDDNFVVGEPATPPEPKPGPESVRALRSNAQKLCLSAPRACEGGLEDEASASAPAFVDPNKTGYAHRRGQEMVTVTNISTASETTCAIDKGSMSEKSKLERGDIASVDSVAAEVTKTTNITATAGEGTATKHLTQDSVTFPEGSAAGEKSSNTCEAFSEGMTPIVGHLLIGNGSATLTRSSASKRTPARQSLRVKRKAVGQLRPSILDDSVTATEEDYQSPALPHQQPAALMRGANLIPGTHVEDPASKPRAPDDEASPPSENAAKILPTVSARAAAESGLEGTKTVIETSQLIVNADNMSSPPVSRTAEVQLESADQGAAEERQDSFSSTSGTKVLGRSEREIPDSIEISSEESESEAEMLQEREPESEPELERDAQPEKAMEKEYRPNAASGMLRSIDAHIDAQPVSVDCSTHLLRSEVTVASFPRQKAQTTATAPLSNPTGPQKVVGGRSQEPVKAKVSQSVPPWIPNQEPPNGTFCYTRPLPRRVSVNDRGSPFHEDEHPGSMKQEESRGSKRPRGGSSSPGPVYPERVKQDAAEAVSVSEFEDSSSERETKRSKTEIDPPDLMMSGFPVHKARGVFEDIINRLSALGRGIHQINRIYQHGMRKITERFSTRRDREVAVSIQKAQNDAELFQKVVSKSRELTMTHADAREHALGVLRTRQADRLREYDAVLAELADIEASL